MRNDHLSTHGVTLFLGAGFSCEAIMPIMDKFGEYSEKQLWGGDPFDGLYRNKNRLSYNLLKRCGETYEAFRKNFRNIKLESFNADNMEDLFTLAELLMECNQERLKLKIEDIESRNILSQQTDIQDLINCIHLWLWQIFRRIPLYDPRRCSEEAVSTYKKFMEHIIDYGKDYGFPNINILTTNYDLIIEYLCNLKNLKISYPIHKSEYEFEPTLCEKSNPSTGCFTVCSNNNHSADYLTLCKLHGSVNFFEPKPDKKDFYRANKVKIIAETGGKVGESNIKNRLPTISALDAIHELYTNRNLLPSLIPPTYAKLTKHAWLRSIWSHALDALSNSQKWIFIGYSFPPTDGHLKSLINLALMKSENPPKVVMVSPSSDIVDNYKPIIGDHFTFYKKRFSEFVNDGDFKEEINI